MSLTLVIPYLPKRVAWVRPYNFDFTKFSEIAAAQTIATAAALQITGPDGALTAGGPVIASGVVQYLITGGTAGATYTVTCQITTSSGSTLTLVGQLQVI